MHRSTRLSKNLADNGEDAERELLDSQIETAGCLAEGLGLARETPAHVLTMRSLVRKRPIALSRHAFPLPRFEDLPEIFVASRSTGLSMVRLGVQGKPVKAGRTVFAADSVQLVVEHSLAPLQACSSIL